MPELPFKSITLKKFRRLQDVSLTGLRRVNILVGENNAGKTSVLEAISLLCRPTDLDGWVDVAYRREANLSGEAPLDAMKWVFPINSRESRSTAEEILLEAEGDVPVTTFKATYAEERVVRDPGQERADQSISPANVTPVPRLHSTIRVEATTGDGNRLVAARSWWEDRLISFRDEHPEPQIPCVLVSGHDHRIMPLQAMALMEAKQEGALESALSLVREVDPEIEEVTLLGKSTRPGVYLRTARTGLAPLSSFGDATRRAVLIALRANAASKGVLLLDEVETSLYKSIMDPFLESVAKRAIAIGAQLFVTTHVLAAVDALADAVDVNEFAVFRLEGIEGKVRVTRTPGDVARTQRHDIGLDVR